MKLDGVKLDLSKIKVPAYFQSAKEDHIAPAGSVFKGTRLFGGPVRFVIAGSGHIAGVINAPAAKKYQYWTNEDGARRHRDLARRREGTCRLLVAGLGCVAVETVGTESPCPHTGRRRSESAWAMRRGLTSRSKRSNPILDRHRLLYGRSNCENESPGQAGWVTNERHRSSFINLSAPDTAAHSRHRSDDKSPVLPRRSAIKSRRGRSRNMSPFSLWT